MEKFKLENGATLVIVDRTSEDLSIAATINVGHINEPKLGMAALFENLLSKQVQNVQTVHGGTITSYLTGCTKTELDETFRMLSELLSKPKLDGVLIRVAAEDIAEHTRDLAPLTKRQMKLLYKHTAFGKKRVLWNADSYIRAVESYTAEDLREFADKYYTGKNMVIVVVGSGLDHEKVREMFKKYFEHIPAGERQRLKKSIYTGGYNVLIPNGNCNQVMLGWDVTDIKGSASANVMMSMLSKRLERSFNEVVNTRTGVKFSRPSDAEVEVKIAGYYGFRTLRISVKSAQLTTNEIIDTIVRNVVRLQNSLPSDRRMETSKNWAMAEKLWLFSQPQPAAVETAWQMLGRDAMYDINERIGHIWAVSAYEIQAISRDIFTGSPLTMVVATKEPHYTYSEVQEKLKVE